jgi:threonine dehydratase
MSKKAKGHKPNTLISISKIYDAARTLKPKVLYTPLIYSSTLSRLFGGRIFLKLENLQKTGSFKVRGATYKLLKNLDHVGSDGVVAASAGNHAQGVALAAREAGVQAFIVMPQWASITKQEATRNYGGQVILHGESISESLGLAQEMAKNGKTLIHPFDDRQIIAGQGTVGLEIVEALPDVDMVIGPVGGGGLLSGIAIAVKSLCPAARIIGVQSKCCPSAFKALDTGQPVTIESMPSVADGINVKKTGQIPFKVLSNILDDIILVNENAIISSILMLLEQKKILVEGAGAVPLAALISGSVRLSSKTNVVLIISGGNIDSSILDRIIHQGLIKDGRIIHFQVILDDRPGSLAKLLGIVASLNANVLHIHHERNDKYMPLFTTRVKLELETRGFSHIKKISKSIESEGYRIL